MSLMISIRRKPQLKIDTSRLHRMQEAWQSGTSSAAERIVPAAQRTRDSAAERMLLARGWSAPRLERAAGYVESDLGPRLSSFLTDTAHRIEPPRPSHRARNAALAMLGMVAAVGVAGALMTRRSAMQGVPEEFMDPRQEQQAPAGDGKVRTP